MKKIYEQKKIHLNEEKASSFHIQKREISKSAQIIEKLSSSHNKETL